MLALIRNLTPQRRYAWHDAHKVWLHFSLIPKQPLMQTSEYVELLGFL